MDEEPYDNYCIVPHPREPRLLLLESATGWTPPRHAETEPDAIAAAMRRQLGLDVTVLRCAYDRARDQPDGRTQVYELENQSPAGTPPAGARWFGREALRDLALAPSPAAPALLRALDAWFDEAESGAVPALRAPWARRGWWAAATAWIREQADRLGYILTDPIEQVKVCAWSTVLRAPTGAGVLYFKATARAAGFEPAVTAAIAALDPGRSPRVLATDPERVWMLMADGGVELREVIRSDAGRARWAACLAEFAQLQIATCGAVERLLALGCPDRRLERLPAQFAQLAGDDAALMVGRPGGLSADDLARARAMLPEVEALCGELERLGIPPAIQHDDLGPGNVLLDAHGDCVFFDWSDSSIAHPLLSCYIPLRWSRYLLKYDQAALDGLRDAYLEPWAAYAPRDDLLAAFLLACRLAKLSRALTWRNFLAGMEPDARWEYEDSVPYFFRMFLNDDEGDD